MLSVDAVSSEQRPVALAWEGVSAPCLKRLFPGATFGLGPDGYIGTAAPRESHGDGKEPAARLKCCSSP